MQHLYIFFAFLFLYFGLEISYFRIARRYAITDTPNSRSSHKSVTIRGGGIVFPIAALIPVFFSDFEALFFSISLLLIAVLSFIDDIKSLSSQLRLTIQSIAIIGLLYGLGIKLDWWLWIICFILITGIINAYNFMDGINGITALYSLVSVASLCWVNVYATALIPDIFFVSFMASLIAFSFFNVRKRALCFAGDVGSVSIAFIICFLLFRLIIMTTSIWWLVFLGIYGMDSVFTIFCRILRKEPLMQAHRSHFYQFLANELHWPHVWISSLYAGAQLLLNISIIQAYTTGNFLGLGLLSLIYLLTYISARLLLEGTRRLFTSY